MFNLKRSVFLSLLVGLNSYAGNALWLTKLIDEHEGRNQSRHVRHSGKQGSFFESHALVLFYGSQCPHCQQFSPTLKRWALKHHAEVMPLSLDNQALPEFPKFIPATTEWINAAFQGNNISYPALFVVNPAMQTIYPVGFGSMTEEELDTRMKGLIPKIHEHEKKGVS